MASITKNGSKGHHKFTLEVNQTSQNIANNTSTISFAFKLSPVETSWNWEQWGAYIKYTVTINGTVYSGNIDNYDGYSTITLKSGTQTISHNADGSKSISYSFNVTDTSGVTYTSGNASNSGTLALTTIPRASTISGGSGNIGEKTTINITRASNSFTHTLKYTFGSLSGTIATGVGASYVWTIPTSFYSQIQNSNTGTGSIICETYSGSTLVGSKSINFTAKVVNSNPTFSASNLSYADTNSSVVTITGNNKHIVQNKSNLKVTYTSATAKNSSTIKKYSFTLNGVTKESTSAGGTIDFGVINSASNLTLTATVTDSRGNTTTASIPVTILPYNTPSTLTTLNRKNNYEDETYLKVDGSIASVNGKNKIAVLQYRYKTIDGNYGDYFSITDNTQYTLSLPNENVYIFEIIIKDSFGSITVNQVTLNKGVFPLFIDTVLNSVGVNCFPKSKNSFWVNDYPIPNARTVAEAETFDIVEEGGELQRSGHYTVNQNNIWYNLINIRHRNGESDGLNYGMQMRNKMLSDGSSLEVRQQISGNWGNWRTIAEQKERSVKENNVAGNTSYIVLGNLLICWGRASITPKSANTPTNLTVQFPKAFSNIPVVQATPITGVPGTGVLGVGVADTSTTAFNIYVTRNNTTLTHIDWVAIGNIN